MEGLNRIMRAALALILLAGLVACLGCSTKGGGKEGLNGGLSEADLNAQREGRFGSGGIPTAEGEGIFRDISFEYDSARVTSSASRDVEYNVKMLRENPDIKVQLEGHCDERGTADYNMALGANRAKAVKDLMISLGVPSSRLDTISYGAEVPLDPGHDEAAWAKNRRVHYSAFRDLPKR